MTRITRAPAAGTPAAQLGFEPGDEIFTMDDQPFREPKDVLEHSRQTTVDSIDVRTKDRPRATDELP